MLVLWVDHGRPVASASVYPWEGSIAHELVSLSRGAKLVAREGDRVVWSPRTPGVEFKDIPGAAAPAESAPARLRQMKELADRFNVTMTGWKADKSDREELRQLPKPLYRADPKEAPGPDSDWIDGGVIGESEQDNRRAADQDNRWHIHAAMDSQSTGGLFPVPSPVMMTRPHLDRD